MHPTTAAKVPIDAEIALDSPPKYVLLLPLGLSLLPLGFAPLPLGLAPELVPPPPHALPSQVFVRPEAPDTSTLSASDEGTSTVPVTVLAKVMVPFAS